MSKVQLLKLNNPQHLSYFSWPAKPSVLTLNTFLKKKEKSPQKHRRPCSFTGILEIPSGSGELSTAIVRGALAFPMQRSAGRYIHVALFVKPGEFSSTCSANFAGRMTVRRRIMLGNRNRGRVAASEAERARCGAQLHACLFDCRLSALARAVAFHSCFLLICPVKFKNFKTITLNENFTCIEY